MIKKRKRKYISIYDITDKISNKFHDACSYLLNSLSLFLLYDLPNIRRNKKKISNQSNRIKYPRHHSFITTATLCTGESNEKKTLNKQVHHSIVMMMIFTRRKRKKNKIIRLFQTKETFEQISIIIIIVIVTRVSFFRFVYVGTRFLFLHLSLSLTVIFGYFSMLYIHTINKPK